MTDFLRHKGSPLETEFQKRWLVQALILAWILFANVTAACSGAPDTPAPTATEEPATKAPTAAVTEEAKFEITENTQVSNGDRLGELNLDYPLAMSPGSSDSVIVSIYIPDRLVSLTPMQIERIEIPPDAPPIIGELKSHQSTIIITKTMRVELASPSFQIERIYSSIQKVDTNYINEPTTWAWTVVAPVTLGKHVLNLQVYSSNNENPSWVGSFKITVAQPTSTPGPTDTLGPTATSTNTPIPTPTMTPTPTPVPYFNPLGRVELIIITALIIGLIIYFVTRQTQFTPDLYKSLDDTKATYKQTLQTLYANLARLELQAAQYGLDVPIRITNEIEETKKKIAEIQARLATLESKKEN